MSRTTISNHDDILDSRDIIARIEELENEQQGYLDAIHAAENDGSENSGEESDHADRLADASRDFAEWEAESGEELDALRAFAKEGEDAAPDWTHGETVIRESHFEDYCQEMLEDIGEMPKDFPSYIVIDWEATARNLRHDYTEIEWDGVTYLVR